MSYIACTDDCIYQTDGVCSLQRAAAIGMPTATVSCVHYVPKHHNSNNKPTANFQNSR